MKRPIRDTLEDACSNGEVVLIIYHGGSQPGTVRAISIISIAEADVRARDLAVGSTKTFKLAKIELAEASTGIPEHDTLHPPRAELIGSIRAVLAAEVEQLQSLGWHVEVTDDEISLHRFFKNGKPRKSPDIRLSYNEYTFDAFVDIDGVFKEESRKSKRPYRLDTQNHAIAKTFAKLSSAVASFLAEAKEHGPGDLNK